MQRQHVLLKPNLLGLLNNQTFPAIGSKDRTYDCLENSRCEEFRATPRDATGKR